MKNIDKFKAFTIIEMLTVIAIIAVLVALLMPTITKVTGRAKNTKAKAEMQSIITAIKSYESTYGILPIPTDWSNGDINSKYDNLMELLTCVKKGAGGIADTYLNSREIRFLDIPQNYTSTSTSINGYRDPWNNKYLIYMDTDYNGQVTGPDSEILYGTVFIYSIGKGGDDNYVYSWK